MTKPEKDKIEEVIIRLEIEFKSCENTEEFHIKHPAVENDFLKGRKEGILEEIKEQKKVLSKTIEKLSKLINYKH